jgi:hypothetical protein
VQFFGMYDGIPLVPRLRPVRGKPSRRAAQGGIPGLGCETGIKSTIEKYKLYQGVNIEAHAVVRRAHGQGRCGALPGVRPMATNNRSAQRRLLHRKGTPGFDKDVRRTLAQFITSNARATSSNYHTQDMLRAAAEAEKDGGDIGCRGGQARQVRARSDRRGASPARVPVLQLPGRQHCVGDGQPDADADAMTLPTCRSSSRRRH